MYIYIYIYITYYNITVPDKLLYPHVKTQPFYNQSN